MRYFKSDWHAKNGMMMYEFGVIMIDILFPF